MFRIDVTFEMRTAVQSNMFIQLISTQNQIVFYIRNGRGGKGQGSRETERERERGRESKHWGTADVASVVKQTVRKQTCSNKQDGQHLDLLSLISKMRNLANDISHARSILTADIF